MNDVYTATVDLPVAPDEAFALVTDPERLRRWTAVAATVELRAGGAWSWTVTPGHVAAGRVREVEPGRRLVLGWGWDGDDSLPPDASTVTVVIEPVGDGSRVTLTHEGLVGAQLDGHAEGWKHYLERLERLAVEGDAGADEWAWAPEHLDPVVAGYATLAVLQPVLRGLTNEDKPKPTPCSEFSCHQVAVHLMESISALGAMGGATVTMPEDGALESKVSRMADQALRAWHVRGLEGTVTDPTGREVPAAFTPAVLCIELLLHGWDLAQGSGQILEVSDEVVAYVAELAAPIIPGGRGAAFADEVVAPEDAGAMDRFAAFSGRQPVAA
ncbi:TIGR03086 family metal-binding protein [Nocardioides cynanchi]|uniref:TIGR03086 family metal-binding protein n=1 Tax=Nocardioides cynanchi TaxID=2558918 RepID=UPI0012475DAE|nr:TIGR03086 family metal-binding protein [Nocardioides cynanchi]